MISNGFLWIGHKSYVGVGDIGSCLGAGTGTDFACCSGGFTGSYF